MLATPVLLMLFNRPVLTQRVFARIREAQPQQLFIAADGARSKEDIEKCAAARQVITQVDWECKVQTLLQEHNLGCKQAGIVAKQWFFDNVTQGILLEDDTLPESELFPFCEELLIKYEHDLRVGMISGVNPTSTLYSPEYSYSFSRHGQRQWGWATWCNRYALYDGELSFLSERNIPVIKANISDNSLFAHEYWRWVEYALKEKLDLQSFQLEVMLYAQNFLVARPKINLVSNIGYGIDASHTTWDAPPEIIRTGKLEFPLRHPDVVAPDREADRMFEKFIQP